MTKIIGGVGGANEATCPYCGKPMKGGYSDGTIVNGWHCASCGLSTDASDAETIQIIKFLEQSGVQDIAYPVWWKQVVH
jgi:tRNA(Ile2) C34 agmatinyltransferase TiaS